MRWRALHSVQKGWTRQYLRMYQHAYRRPIVCVSFSLQHWRAVHEIHFMLVMRQTCVTLARCGLLCPAQSNNLATTSAGGEVEKNGTVSFTERALIKRCN